MINMVGTLVELALQADKTDKVLARHLRNAVRRIVNHALNTNAPAPVPTREYKGYYGNKDGCGVTAGYMTEGEVVIGKNQGKIAAIRAVRERTLLGLRESKELVEDVFITHGFQFFGL